MLKPLTRFVESRLSRKEGDLFSNQGCADVDMWGYISSITAPTIGELIIPFANNQRVNMRN
jgi:hypothetical protein